MTTKKKTDPAVKEAIIKRLVAGEPVKEIEKETKIANSILYVWRKKAMKGQDPQGPARKVPITETIALLRQAEVAIFKDIRNGKIKKLSTAENLTILALRTLEG